MENDKLKKTMGQVSNFASNCFGRVNYCLDKLLAKMRNFDDSSDLKTRFISSAILLPLAIAAICFFKGLFFLFAVAIAILMTVEWLELTKSAQDQQKWRLIGFVYILLPITAILELRDIDPGIVLWVFAVIWATDIFAYFAGKNFGGAKMSPNISPNKTWSGLVGGVLASMVIGFLSSFMFVSGNILFFTIISGLLALLEQTGDLLESKVKRTFNVKDSGNIIPGHGGILDRLDGLMLVAPAVLILVWVFSEKFMVR
jgi:phosphatidate cytidylyltransferase